MEALGQLTGGIAHDFNSMLQSVTSGITIAQQRIDKSRPEDAQEFLDAALMAADRAAALTRRLLSFGRRQALNPKAVELGGLFREVAEMIRQTVGPGIKTDLQLEEACWPVSCDQNQLENALINLAINARDAMSPAGGRLLIKTLNVSLAEPDTRDWEDVEPGDYVRITVTDTGAGMSPDVIAHAFEPFFTTKPDGQGTGLGLSQIYGFIRQSRGMVSIDSELGMGTSVHLYLPRSQEASGGKIAKRAAEGHRQPVAAPETASVLLVEDQAVVRGFAAEALRELGYRVVEAGDGLEGLKALREALCTADQGPLRLLVTDIGLPGGLNGRQLADAARELAADLPILLITGYAGDALKGHGHLGPGMEILSKPFKLDVLAKRVQAMIGEAKSP
jgi:CheY-like chemotaxis protein